MKLSELTNEQKTRLLAELDDYQLTQATDGAWEVWHGGKSIYADNDPKANYIPLHILPDYRSNPDGYRAIIPLVQRLPLQQYRSVVNIIWNQTYEQVFKATPSQLCDAVLVATGKAEL